MKRAAIAMETRRAETGNTDSVAKPWDSAGRNGIAQPEPPMTKGRSSPQVTERQVQRSILAMCGTCFRDVYIHHSPNGSKLAGSERDRQVTGGILKGDGMKAGFPDLICLWRGGGAFIEVKRPKIGVLSDAQISVHNTLRALGWPVATVTSQDEAYTFLRQCGAPCSAEMRVAA